MLPISNMAMLSSAYLALSGDFNADLIDLGRLALGNLLIMGLVQPLVNHIHAGLGLRGALFLALCVVSVACLLYTSAPPPLPKTLANLPIPTL